MKKFKHKKSLGQNFLKNNEIINKIVNSVSVSEKDLIIEIGPGHGILTEALKILNANLICYEVDERLKKYLDKFNDEKTKIIYNDFLKTDITSDIKIINYENIYIVANIPYYITTPIIEHIIDSKIDVSRMILMVQNEVANRICAKPKSKAYGSLTVYLNYFFEIEKLFVVDRKEFDPIPNVDSAVISLKKRVNKYDVKNEEVFFKLITDSFKQKRKTIKNNLFNYDINLIEEILVKNNLSLKSRAEEINIDVFVEISNSI